MSKRHEIKKKITIIISERLAKFLVSALDLHILQMCLLKFPFWYFPLTWYVKHRCTFT